MIDKRDVQVFFDRLAPDWDAGMVRNEAVIARILDNAGVCEGCTVLDVACGTGVLFGDYVKRGCRPVAGNGGAGGGKGRRDADHGGMRRCGGQRRRAGQRTL